MSSPFRKAMVFGLAIVGIYFIGREAYVKYHGKSQEQELSLSPSSNNDSLAKKKPRREDSRSSSIRNEFHEEKSWASPEETRRPDPTQAGSTEEETEPLPETSLPERVIKVPEPVVPVVTEAEIQSYRRAHEALREAEDWTRKHPPEGPFLLGHRKKYQALLVNPLDEDIARQARDAIHRIDKTIREAVRLYKYLLEAERRGKRQPKEVPWLASLIAEVEKDSANCQGAPEVRRIKTVLKRMKNRNEKSKEKYNEIKKEEEGAYSNLDKISDDGRKQRERTRRVKILIRKYQSVITRYPGTQGAQQAHQVKRDLENQLENQLVN